MFVLLSNLSLGLRIMNETGLKTSCFGHILCKVVGLNIFIHFCSVIKTVLGVIFCISVEWIQFDLKWQSKPWLKPKTETRIWNRTWTEFKTEPYRTVIASFWFRLFGFRFGLQPIRVRNTNPNRTGLPNLFRFSSGWIGLKIQVKILVWILIRVTTSSKI